MKGSKSIFLILLVAGFCILNANAQRPTKRLPRPEKVQYFAVLEGGKEIEPIGEAEKGKFPGEDSASPFPDASLADLLVPKKTFGLIFGGVPNGRVTVAKKNTGDCAGTSATVSVTGSSAKLGGFVMGLAATATKSGDAAKPFRRAPTAAERSQIEKLVRAEFANAKVPASAMRPLHSYNLTAIDVDHDGEAELVGSYWAAPKKDRRVLLFFIVAKGADGRLEFQHKALENVGPDDLMSGDPADLDEIGGELLLDSADVDGDGVNEIFTTTQAFEGRNFTVYGRKGTNWQTLYKSYNYRCGY